MAFELKPTRHVLTVHFAATGEDIDLYYRPAKPKERLAYSNATMRREGKKVLMVQNPYPLQVRYGKAFVTGFPDGAFTVEGKPVSSDPEAEGYYPEWRELMEEACPDALALVCQRVMSAATVARDLDDGGLEFVEELDGPLPTPSTGTSPDATENAPSV
ncbi:hypothetical protein G3N56_11665 [Desulfovibrio sulfodismutans]|uniref:Uncharacterized protein n=1 Tax=Desulfolutivibrio sulfodismutans TaxID=63561 RepID=A0A7K3NMK2_9BACT|nr:hypothetical protein [Desulfolutivibrio sulfodismutans]NDY57398.1 hypothetical protein [Desulfolutivibrio sulfodismutans]QLA11880.1 hypothetical protein GD606_06200 [Desulfolutivibrio sulfodismutans DSM 3696]QLA13539.1 hypothetical protein GD606_15335 [Desulfolutivibrio sulfodismutans DSM 3696]